MKLMSRSGMLVGIAVVGLSLSACGKKEEAKPAEPAATSEPAKETAAAEPAAAEPAAADPAKDPVAAADPAAADPAAAAAAAPADSAEVMALKGIAKTILEAYKGKDLEKLAAFAPEEVQAQLKTLKPGDKVYDQIFDETNWRWKSVSGWDGTFMGVRQSEDSVWVQYAKLEGEEIAVVKLKKTGDKWLFDDLGSPDMARWNGWGTELK